MPSKVGAAIQRVDRATGTKAVTKAAIAFHEFAEAAGKIERGQPAYAQGGVGSERP